MKTMSMIFLAMVTALALAACGGGGGSAVQPGGGLDTYTPPVTDNTGGTGTVEGYLTEAALDRGVSSANGIGGAEVWCEDGLGQRLGGDVTDGDGYYCIDGVPAGEEITLRYRYQYGNSGVDVEGEQQVRVQQQQRLRVDAGVCTFDDDGDGEPDDVACDNEQMRTQLRERVQDGGPTGNDGGNGDTGDDGSGNDGSGSDSNGDGDSGSGDPGSGDNGNGKAGSGVIEGQLTRERAGWDDREPVEGAEVWCEDAQTRERLGQDTTDEHGNYCLEGLPEGTQLRLCYRYGVDGEDCDIEGEQQLQLREQQRLRLNACIEEVDGDGDGECDGAECDNGQMQARVQQRGQGGE
jgi:hypothetical protein